MNENTNTENTAAQVEEPKKGPIKKVTKDMIISDLAMEDAGIVDILMDAGMHCLFCSAAFYESLEEASMVHGIDADDLVAQINEYLELKNSSKKEDTSEEANNQ